MGSLKIFLIPLYFCKMLASKYIHVRSNKIMLWKWPFSPELLRRGLKNIYFCMIYYLHAVCIWKQAQLLRTCSRKVLNFSDFLEVHTVIYTTQVIIHIGLQWVYIGMICVVTFWSYDESYNDDGHKQKRSQ